MRTSEQDTLLILGTPVRPAYFSQEQFDGSNDFLHDIANDPKSASDTAWWAYRLDLHYVTLDRGLFRWAFPHVLKQWRELMFASHWQSEPSFWELVGSRRFDGTWLLESMLPPGDRSLVFRYIRDVLLDRMELENSLVLVGNQPPKPYGWFDGLAALGYATEEVPSLVDEWCRLGTPGHAIAAVQYVSCLTFGEYDNPVFAPSTPEEGGGPPSLSESGIDIRLRQSVPAPYREYATPAERMTWKRVSATTFDAQVTVAAVRDLVNRAAVNLRSHPHAHIAERVARECANRGALIADRLVWLRRHFSTTDTLPDWPVA